MFDRVACIEFIYHFWTSWPLVPEKGRDSGRKPFAVLLLYKSDKGEFSRIHSAIQFQLHFPFRLFVLQLNRETLFFTFLFLIILFVCLNRILSTLVHVGKRISVKFQNNWVYIDIV